MKVLVLGGGIGGLATAVALKQIGLDVSVFERAAALERVGAGLSLWANATAALRHLGLEEKAIAKGAEIKVSQICRSDGRPLAKSGAGDFAKRTGLKAFAIHRGDLQTLLCEALGSEPLHLDKVGVFVEQHSGVSVQFEDGTEAEGAALIAADGLNSSVRKQLFDVPEPSYQGYTVWRGVAQLQLGEVQAGQTFEAWGCGLRFGLLPLNEREVYWYAAENAAEGRRLELAEAKSRLQTLFHGWRFPIGEVLKATEAEAILNTDVYALPPLRTWVKDRVGLLGDAAHAMAPNLGQGACQALEDAVVLARCFEKVKDVNAALTLYEKRRLTRVHKFQRLSKQAGSVGQLSHPVLCALRDRFIPLVPKRFQRNQSSDLYTFEI